MSDQLPGSHFYAVPLSGRMECPRCGRMILWNKTARNWDPVRSMIRCITCNHAYVLGIIAWPAKIQHDWGREYKHPKMPPDQIATLRQLAESRQYAGGFWVHQPWGRKAAQPVNRYIAEGCTCAPLPWSASCPVHGGLTMSDPPVRTREGPPDPAVIVVGEPEPDPGGESEG